MEAKKWRKEGMGERRKGRKGRKKEEMDEGTNE